MINNRRFCDAGCLGLLPMTIAIATAGTLVGALDRWPGALDPSNRRAVARVIAVSGSVSGIMGGRSRPLAVGSALAADELVATGACSMVRVGTPDGSFYDIVSESRVKFCENRWSGLSRLDRWLSRARNAIQRFGGAAPADSLGTPTTVIAVRASVFSSSAKCVARLENGWIGMGS